jgi:demethylspheroidene O-methyltransferase
MGFRESWIARRNALLLDPRFQRWAMRFPLTRPIVRLRSAALFDTVAGFVYAQVLSACIEIGLLEQLRDGPATVEEIGSLADLPHASARRLLRAAASLDLAEALPGDRFALGAQGAALLGNPGVAAMVKHHRLLYDDLADPLALLRAGKGRLAGYWGYASAGSADVVEGYSKLMAATQPMVVQQVLDAYDFGRHRHLLDIGGGEGTFLDAVGMRYPALSLSLFDLPAVADRARIRLGARAAIHPGSFLNDPLPNSADIMTLVRILHDHDDEPAAALLANAADALERGGTLLIAEPMAGTPGARPMGDAYFGFYLLAMGSGRPRHPVEIGDMLMRVGFRKWRRVSTDLPLIVSVIVATR